MEIPVDQRSKKLPSALKHGAFSATAILPGEDAGAFKKLRDGIIAELAPNGPLEDDIVDTVVHLTWRKQNLSTYRIAQMAKDRIDAVESDRHPPSGTLQLFNFGPDTRSLEVIRAEKEKYEAAYEVNMTRLQKELGPAWQLAQIDGITIENLLDELTVLDRLDGMIDRCIKRLLMVRGVKSLVADAASTPASPRKRLSAA
jgi:hypothetical protein